MASAVKLATSSILGVLAFCVLLFVPAGTLSYWQGWAFIAVFLSVSLVPSLFLNRIDPAAVERRRKAGPTHETRAIQKLVMTGLSFCFAALLVVSGLDHRFGWSSMPAAVSILGDVMVVVGLGGAMLVVFQNRYAAATITLEADQPIVTTGLYGIVRHPMYSASVVMMIGMALALGSYWALLLVAAGSALLIVRIRDEEKLLSHDLPGYPEYMATVRYRLLPLAW